MLNSQVSQLSQEVNLWDSWYLGQAQPSSELARQSSGLWTGTSRLMMLLLHSDV